jgi:hypothetical protein
MDAHQYFQPFDLSGKSFGSSLFACHPKFQLAVRLEKSCELAFTQVFSTGFQKPLERNVLGWF